MSAPARASWPARAAWPAPAKLNLFLHVTGRRADGYHELQTLFQLVDLADTIDIEVTAEPTIERTSGPADVAPADDLVVRAARVLQAECGVRRGARLAVRKRIPIGGGLGGGSSDAATVLLALNAMWKISADRDKLLHIGRSIGADVPVFIAGQSAWAEGTGERLTPVQLPEKWFVIIHPRVHVPTAQVFQAAELTRNSALITIRAFFESGGRNDCEPVVRERFPAVADALDWLAQHAAARLTGTGSCVFAAFDRAIDAERVATRVPDEWTGFVARGLNESPVHAMLARLEART